MQTKLQELTTKIYHEGVEKAEAEAAKIIQGASEEATRIVEQARQEAGTMIEAARNESEELRRNSLNELQLAARQMESELRQKIIQMIEAELIPSQTAPLFRDPVFLRELILKAAGNWNPESGEPVSLEVLLPEDMLQQVRDFAVQGTGVILGKGVKLMPTAKSGHGFQIGPAGGGYRISFTDEDFNLFFRAYLRPRLQALLFGAKEQHDTDRA